MSQMSLKRTTSTDGSLNYVRVIREKASVAATFIPVDIVKRSIDYVLISTVADFSANAKVRIEWLDQHMSYLLPDS